MCVNVVCRQKITELPSKVEKKKVHIKPYLLDNHAYDIKRNIQLKQNISELHFLLKNLLKPAQAWS